MSNATILEISVECDAEAAEAVSELFNRFNGGDYDADSEAGEASGGGAVIETTGYDDFNEPIAGEFRIVVKTYLKPGVRGAQIRQQIEEGLWFLSRIYPIPEPHFRDLREEDWANAWKRFYKPLRVGRRILLKPSWESVEVAPDDILVELDPGMAFGTGLHPSTRLCIAALEETVKPGDAVLDVGTGSGVLAVVAHKLGAASILATDIDPIAVEVAQENARRNAVPLNAQPGITVHAGQRAGEHGRALRSHRRQHPGRGAGQTLRRRLRLPALSRAAQAGRPAHPGWHHRRTRAVGDRRCAAPRLHARRPQARRRLGGVGRAQGVNGDA
jgi:ribosomal protein L11 methyltransferase